jgi:broad specificity phosphatase PhoE
MSVGGSIMELDSREAREAKKAQTILILVRHADTELREDGSKDDDSPLSSRGLEQIPTIIESLRAYRAQHIYASDTRRAAQTANEIGTALALPVQLLPSLREGSFNIGSQSGIKTEEGNQQESVQAFQQRVSESVDGIVSEWPEECTVVVAHSGTIRAALHHLLQLPLSAYEVPSIAQGSMLVLVKQFGGSWNSAG